MLQINLTIIIQVAQFLILVLILNRLLFRPISEVMAERRQKLQACEGKSRLLHDSVQARLQSYEKELRQARAQARERQEQLTREVKEKEQERLRAASAEAAQLVAATREHLQEETERLREEIRQQTAELSELVAEKVLGRKLDEYLSA